MGSLKSWVKAHSPAPLARAYRKSAIAREYLRDFRDYARSTDWEAGSAGRRPEIDPAECASSRLIIASHGLEKGAAPPRNAEGAAHPRQRRPLLQSVRSDDQPR